MGKASTRKAERRKFERDRPNLERRLRQHHEQLEVLGEAFDAGRVSVALSLATSVRVLVHDTDSSRSLLKQLGEKDALLFLDTAGPLHPGNLMPTWGLVAMTVRTGSTVQASWVPHLDNPPPSDHEPYVPFQPWWLDPIVKDAAENLYCRKDLILAVANKEGGAHVDPKRDERYRAYEEGNVFAWETVDQRGNLPFNADALLPSIRQIAHELQRTIESGMPGALSMGDRD